MTRGLTLEEQERRAYASGDPSAPLLALALDGHASVAADLQMVEEQRDAAQAERDAATRLLAEAEKRIVAARAVLNGDRVVAP